MDGSDCCPTLGWLSGFEPWEIAREHFPSKVGGIPAWLSLNLPPQSEFLCNECGNILTFCLQVYAPDDRHDHAFHRTLYFFICQPCGNKFAIFRNQLPRDNQFFGYNPLEPGITLDSSKEISNCCVDCGLPCSGPALDKNSQSIKALSITDSDTTGPGCNSEPGNLKFDDIRKPNRVDLRHKRCEIGCTHKTLNIVFPEYIINIGAVEDENGDFEHENQLYQKYLAANDLSNGTNDLEDQESENYDETFDTIEEQRFNTLGNDACYDRFRRITGHQDVVYYHRHGDPLWVSNKNRKLGDQEVNWTPPPCQICKGNRSFEFQILPQLLHYLDNDRIEFASIAVYTCASSCAIQGYVQEFIRPEYEESLRFAGKWKGIC